jgi:hypothetical protein
MSGFYPLINYNSRNLLTPALIPSSDVKEGYQERLLDQDILSYWAYRKEACLGNSFEQLKTKADPAYEIWPSTKFRQWNK